jgi:hypothetical protein
MFPEIPAIPGLIREQLAREANPKVFIHSRDCNHAPSFLSFIPITLRR